MNGASLAFAGIAVISTCVFAQPSQLADSLFRYDQTIPLDVRDSLIESTDRWQVYDVSYTSPREGRVTAYLVVPAEKGRHPAILFGHWGPGNRTEFLPEAKLYARAGAVSLMIDYPWVRPAPYRVNQGRGFDEPEKDLAVFSQSVVDLRRGIDLLVSRPDVDSSRMAYVGHSYGAQWGAILSVIDRRIKAVVLMAGVPSDSVFIVENTDPDAVAIRESATEELRETYMRIVTVPLAAISFVPFSYPTPLFFQFALKERLFTVDAMNRYYEAASQPKMIKWYVTGHELNDPQALIDRAKWLGERLNLGSVTRVLRTLVE